MSIIVGDIAGQYNALLRLVAKFPKDEPIILVGDIIDRGPHSKDVVEWARTNPLVRAIRGNHEDMFIDHVEKTKRYDYGLWYENGGGDTLASYGDEDSIPADHIAWLKSLPLYIEEEGFFISHAPIANGRSIAQAKEFSLEEIEFRPKLSGLLWNRDFPDYIEGVIQVFGHNANFGLKQFFRPASVQLVVSDKPYAICLDDSWQDKVTGLNTKTLEVYQEPYV